MTRLALPTSREGRIALAGATILSCINPARGDQMAPEHTSAFEDSTVAIFTVAAEDWERGQELEATIGHALRELGFTTWVARARNPEVGGPATAVAIRVVVGAPETGRGAHP